MKKLAFAAAGLLSLSLGSAFAQDGRGGVITVATIGEPPTLDAMLTSTDVVGMISQHIFETLYTFGKGWQIVPLLAADLPAISEDGKVYTIPLRTGVSFQDGTAFDSADVVASLKRWTEVAARGKQVAPLVGSIEAVDATTVRITLTQPYAPLLALLSFNNSAAIMLSSENQDAQSIAIVGTGPYALKEHKPDQYIQLVRYDGYASLPGEPDGFGGARKQNADEIRFIPVPDSATRVENAIAGQYDYVDSLPVEQFDRIEAGALDPVLTQDYGWLMMRMNNKTGIMSNPAARRAVQLALSESDMLAAAFGDEKFYRVNGDMYPEGFPWATDAGVEGHYDVADATAAKAELAAAGQGQKLRILTSRQYEFHYRMAQVAVEYLKLAGFEMELEVVDWATLVQRIQTPELWDIFITHSPFLAEPALNTILSPTAVSWWNTPEINAAMAAFTSTNDLDERIAAWKVIQELIMTQVPMIKVGNFSALAAMSDKIVGFETAPWPYFWNVTVSGN